MTFYLRPILDSRLLTLIQMHVLRVVKTPNSLGLLTALVTSAQATDSILSSTLWHNQPFSPVWPAGGATPRHPFGCLLFTNWSRSPAVFLCALWTGGGARQKDGIRPGRSAIPSTALHRTAEELRQEAPPTGCEGQVWKLFPSCSSDTPQQTLLLLSGFTRLHHSAHKLDYLL